MTTPMNGASLPTRWLRIQRIVANQVDIYRRSGLRGNVSFFRRWREARLPRGTYANGLRVHLSESAAMRHARRGGAPLVVVRVHPTDAPGAARTDLAALATEVRAEVAMETWDGADWTELRARLRRSHPGADVLLVEDGGGIPSARDVAMLRFAAATYAIDGGRVGIVVPRLRDASGTAIEGFEWDRAERAWVRTAADPRYRRGDVPRYVLAAPAHGMLITAAAVEGADEAGDLRALVRAGWRAGLRTLVLPMVVLEASMVRPPAADDADLAWRTGRAAAARTSDGRLRIVYVLKATTISGGIRTVFEQSRVLREAGHDVEIWSLQGQPDWIDNEVPVKTFADFPALRRELEDSDAIAIATWWETALVVWLACVNRGLACYYVQEFETWFYPGDPISQGAVASSYRREMSLVTIADYQRDELAELGVPATTISSAYDPTKFRELSGVSRRDDTVLAVGRTFFQKNFALTLAAWRSLGDRRPRMQLFGFEPELVDDARMEYEVRPTDERVNELYNEATCFVQTSLHEGFCLPILEAMAAGCPVITTDSHGNRDFCVAEVNCIEVEQHDVDGLAAAIERVLGDAALRDRLRRAGLETAVGRTWPIVTAALAEHYAGLD